MGFNRYSFHPLFIPLQTDIAIVGYFKFSLPKKSLETPTDYEFIPLAFFYFKKGEKKNGKIQFGTD